MQIPTAPHETWEPIEVALRATAATETPYTDRSVTATFEHESGDRYEIPGFWDGGRDWCVRFAPPVAGTWTWRTESDPEDRGLIADGEFSVREYDGGNPIKGHGHLEPRDHHLAHADGTPFFWLGDTVWSAAAKATPEEWSDYLDARVKQGYNVVQLNTLPQHDAARPYRRLPFGEDWDLDSPRPAYFRALDGLIAAANARGIVPALVALWFNYVPGTNEEWDGNFHRHPFSEEQATRWGRYLAARYGAYGAVWFVSGDWEFTEDALTVYDAVAESIRDNVTHPICAAHMPGMETTAEPLNEREWLDIHAYQSGHHREGLGRAAPRTLARRHRDMEPTRPVLDAEPCYENMAATDGPEDAPRFDRKDVRIAGWGSVMAGANVGITYGGNGIWQWYRDGEHFEGVPWIEWMGHPIPWHEGLDYEGARDYATMKRILSRFAFAELTPRQDLLRDHAPEVLAAEVPTDDVLLVYSPESREIRLDCPIETGTFVHPATQQEVPAIVDGGEETATVAAPNWTRDALLVARR